MRRLGLVCGLGVAAAVLVAMSGIPAFGADNGTVAVTVSVQDVPCISVGTTTINYGTKSFSTPATFSTASGTISNVSSCSGASQTLYAKGTDAAGTGAAWQLTDIGFSCSVPELDKFKHSINMGGGLNVALALVNKELTGLTPNQTGLSLPVAMVMPCQGSQGAGKQMSTSIILTATVP